MVYANCGAIAVIANTTYMTFELALLTMILNYLYFIVANVEYLHI